MSYFNINDPLHQELANLAENDPFYEDALHAANNHNLRELGRLVREIPLDKAQSRVDLESELTGDLEFLRGPTADSTENYTRAQIKNALLGIAYENAIEQVHDQKKVQKYHKDMYKAMVTDNPQGAWDAYYQLHVLIGWQNIETPLISFAKIVNATQEHAETSIRRYHRIAEPKLEKEEYNQLYKTMSKWMDSFIPKEGK